MLKNDIVDLYRDVKSFYFFTIHWIRNNPFIALSVLIIYLFLFLIDPFIRSWFSGVHNNFSDTFFYIGHFYGQSYLTFFVILFLYSSGLLLKNERFRKTGWIFFEAYAVSGIIVTVLKSIFGRWRPYTEHGNLSFIMFNFSSNDHLSLPSGDVAVAFAFSAVMASFVDNKVWKVFCFLLAGLTALARIYHDQHWLTDVILSAVISVSFGIHLVKENHHTLSNGFSQHNK